jgi:hypothetical protein
VHIWLVIALAVIAAGCGPNVEAVEREQVVQAIDALRDAPAEPLERRKDLLGKLERTPASVQDAVRARGACASAYRLLVEGTELRKKVQAALEKEEEPTAALAQQVILAEAKIKKSNQLMPECDEAAAELRLAARKK